MKAGCTWLASSRPALQADICSSHNTRGRVGIAFRLSNQGNLQPTEPRIPPEAITSRTRLRGRPLAKVGCIWLASSRPIAQAGISPSHDRRWHVCRIFRGSNPQNLQPSEAKISSEAISPSAILPISHMWMTRPSAAKHASATVSERVGWAWTELCRSSRVASSVRANVASAIISVASGPII